MTRRESWIDGAVVLVTVVWVATVLRADLIVVDSVPAGGDATAHVLWADVMRRVFSEGRVSGWSLDWFAGFPVGRFYYPLPAGLIAALSLVLPFLVGFKLVMVIGAVLLPAAVFVFLRGLGAFRPVPPVGALLTVPFLLFERSTLVLGGNLASVLAGELAFSLALTVGLFALGALSFWLRGGRRGGWLAVLLLSATLLSHVLVGLWILLVAAVVVVVLGGSRRWVGVMVVASAVALTGVWLVPLIWELGMVTDPGFPRSSVVGGLLPGGWWWMLVLAGAGLVWSFRSGWGARWVVAAWLGLIGVAVAALPAGLVVSNARLLPFWDLGLVIAGAVGLGGSVRRLKSRLVGWVMLSGALLVVGAGFVFVGDVRGRAATVLSGLEQRSSWSELEAVAATLEGLPPGRVVWEVFPGLSGYGSPFVLQLLPYLTAGHVATLDGLHRESSASSPAIERLLSEVSAVGRRSMSNVDYGSLDDFDQGVGHLRLFGVRWYLAASAAAKGLADVHPDLRLVVSLAPADLGPVAAWSVYEVRGSVMVEGLSSVPAVVSDGVGGWREVSDLWMGSSGWPVRLVAESGPSDWPRGNPTTASDPLTHVVVSDLEVAGDRVSFSVDVTGVPVLVKVSYAPGWTAHGGAGPYRVTPNLMVVVPEGHHVELLYGPTFSDRIGVGVSVLGLAGLVGVIVVGWRGGGRTE